MYFGLLDTQYTGGEIVGYYYIYDTGIPDEIYAYSIYPEFVRPDLPVGTGAWLPFLAKVFGKLRELGATKVILDHRNNAGGFQGYCQAIASFFGGNRAGSTDSYVQANNGNTPPISLEEIANDTGSVILKQQNIDEQTINTNLTAEKFPEAIFRDGQTVVYLTNTNSASGGDIVPHFFTNPAADDSRDLGFGVICNIVGNIDGRLHGAASAELPVNQNVASVYNIPDDIPVGPLTNTVEQGSLTLRAGSDPYYFSNQVSYTAPELLLNNNFTKTTLVDTGFIQPYPDEIYTLPNKAQPQPDDNTTWRDLWLEASIYAVLNPNLVSLSRGVAQQQTITRKSISLPKKKKSTLAKPKYLQ